MKCYFNVAIAAVVIGAALSAPAQARQERTVESAHSFLQQMLTRGRQGFYILDSRDNYTLGQAGIDVVRSSGCSTSIEGYSTNTSKSYTRRIDWRNVSEIRNNYDGSLYINGAITMSDGSLRDSMLLTVGGGNDVDRVVEAMRFIQSKCDGAKGAGW